MQMTAITETAPRTYGLTRMHWMGVASLAIFAWRLLQYISVSTPDWIMYNCHLATLAFGIALLVDWPRVIRVMSIWLFIGLPMWLIDAWVFQVIWVASVFSHLGGFVLAWLAMKRVRATGVEWLPAWLWFLGVQMLTRLTTRPELNINIAHTPYQLFRDSYSSYWTFWWVCALVVLVMVWLVERLHLKLFPRRSGREPFFIIQAT